MLRHCGLSSLNKGKSSEGVCKLAITCNIIGKNNTRVKLPYK